MSERHLEDQDLEQVSGGSDSTELEQRDDGSAPADSVSRRGPDGDRVRLPADGDRVAPADDA